MRNVINLRPFPLQSHLDTWVAAQEEMDSIKRWILFNGRPDTFPIRQQCVTTHTMGMLHLADMICLYIETEMSNWGIGFSDGFLQRMILHHDEPEGILKRDVPAIHKKKTDDYDEFLALRSRYEYLPPRMLRRIEDYFLAQFCLEIPSIFPKALHTRMRMLATLYEREVLVFQSLEKFEYLLYVKEQLDRGNELIFAQVSRNQVGPCEELAARCPPFREFYWKPVKDWFATELPKFEGLFKGPQGSPD